MNNGKDFVAWVCDPARTNDELFAVELVIEMMRIGLTWPFRERQLSFEDKLEQQQARAANPGYRPTLRMDEIEELGRRTATATQFNSSGGWDRILRDLSPLRFFPALETVSISAGDVRDLTPLGALEKVKSLTIMEGNYPGATHPLDLAQCGEKPLLERLTLALRHPWPDLRAIAKWPMHDARFLAINVLALAEVKELPEAKVVVIGAWADTGSILRDLRNFPAMPKVKQMNLYKTASLEGIERYPTILNLEIGGPFADLEPLTRLTNVTALTLVGEHFDDLTPLTRMPKLRELHLMRERPIDLTPLTEAPELRRVRFSRCAIMRTEVGALNAGLLPEAPDFEAPEPRTLGPLKFYKLTQGNKEAEEFFREREANMHATREEFYAGDMALSSAEGRCFRGALHGKLTQLLGHGWGLVEVSETHSTPGYLHIVFKRFRDTTRVREIVQLLREESARARFPWIFVVHMRPHGDMTDELEQLKELEEKAKDPEEYWLAKYYTPEAIMEEQEEQRRFHEERYEQMEREHLFHLQQQQGMVIDPELMHAPEEPEARSEEEETAEEDEPLTNSMDEPDEGGVAIAPPPPAPPDTESLADQLEYYLKLYEDCMTVAGHYEGQARYSLGEAPVEWTPETAA